ncbi:MAG: hypothetical protein QM755_19605 [Luteolibacter sp.]
MAAALWVTALLPSWRSRMTCSACSSNSSGIEVSLKKQIEHDRNYDHPMKNRPKGAVEIFLQHMSARLRVLSLAAPLGFGWLGSLQAAAVERAPIVKEPLSDFVAVIRANDPDEVWFVGGDEDVIPKGGYLLRFRLDLDGDGRQELFLGSSLEGFGCDRKGNHWACYRQDDAGRWHRLTRDVFIGSDLRRSVVDGRKRYSNYTPQREWEGGSFVGFFWLGKDGAWNESFSKLTPEKKEELGDDSAKVADYFGQGKEVKRHIEKLLLAQYVQNPAAAWKPTKDDYSMGQQYLDLVDKADIAGIKLWSPPVSDETNKAW